MIPTPIQQALSTFQKHQVQALLMGGQACVFYGAAQFSRDIHVVIIPPLDAEVRAEQAKDRAYWEPLRKGIEQFSREERLP